MPRNTFKTLHEFVKAARLNLNQTHWDYLIGGSETETTLLRNRQAIEQRALMPKVLNDVSEVNTRSELLGCRMAMPVILAPIGSLQVLDPQGGAGAASAAAEANVMSFASSVCERDIAKRVVPTSQASPGDFRYQAKLAWSDVARIKREFDLPLIVKGINHPDDAKRAIDLGVEVIYVSNHGGRQLDHGLGSLDLLTDIKAAVLDQAEVIIDGGFYRGTDIVKALALGADAVGLGRLQGWALAAGGPEALTSCLQILHKELVEALALCGLTDISEVHPELVRPATQVSAASALSAFPLLNEGY